jgi:cyclopropane-fatty-acyl-phospholipid synthase
MLDSRMIYSCGYWRGADTLEAAQEAKLMLIANKLGLEAGMRVLDIGCG